MLSVRYADKMMVAISRRAVVRVTMEFRLHCEYGISRFAFSVTGSIARLRLLFHNSSLYSF